MVAVAPCLEPGEADGMQDSVHAADVIGMDEEVDVTGIVGQGVVAEDCPPDAIGVERGESRRLQRGWGSPVRRHQALRPRQQDPRVSRVPAPSDRSAVRGRR